MTHPDEPERVVIRDKRRIDPETGETRTPDIDAAASAPTPGAEAAPAADPEAYAELAERTADLQRVQAEFANYRKRMERDRVAISERAVADQFDAILAKLGLVSFAEPGDPFDPAIHEAVLHDESTEVSVPTATTVMRRGYQHGDRLLRPAMVGVSDPSAESPAATEDSPAQPVDEPLPDSD